MKTKKRLIYIFSFAAINQALSFLPLIPQAIYYLLMAIGFLFVLLEKPKRVNFLVVLFILASMASLFVNDVPPLFSANQRLLIFIIISSAIGPLLDSFKIYSLRHQIFIIINKVLILFSALSFITYILGIGFPWSGTGSNSGLFNHSLMLGPMAAVSILLIFYININYKSFNFNVKHKKYVYILLVLTSLALLVSSSRTSIIGLLAALFFFTYKVNQNKLGKFVATIFKFVFVIIISSPVWLSYTEGIRKKMERVDEKGDLTESRNLHWNARLYEFNSSPIFGIGFATGDINSPLAIGINEETGGLEPGSSWMAILAMTGIFGFIAIALLFIHFLVFLWKDKKNLSESGLLGGLLIFFSLHMGAEGYFLAAGSFLFFYLWLLLGVIQGYKNYGAIKLN